MIPGTAGEKNWFPEQKLLLNTQCGGGTTMLALPCHLTFQYNFRGAPSPFRTLGSAMLNRRPPLRCMDCFEGKGNPSKSRSELEGPEPG